MTYILNGKEIKYLNRLVLETVKQYIQDNVNITYSELKNIFKDSIQGSYGVVKNEVDLNKLSEFVIDTPKRFFMNENEILHLSNGDKIYVCKGWGDDYTDSNGKYKRGNKKPFIELVKELNYKIEIIDNKINKSKFNSKEIYMLNTKNIILYGAPGVGKTHNYQRLISMIENGENEKTIFDTITNNKSDEKVELDKETFQKIKNDKRVEFITFHQSYSYEDFIEGFRPNENGSIELEDGVFKQIAYNSIFEKFSFSKESIKILDFDTAFDNLILDCKSVQ